MKINLITVSASSGYNAIQKAPNDIISILREKFNVRITIIGGTNNSKNIFSKLIKRLKFSYEFLKARLKNEIVILQFPMYETTPLLNKIFLFNMNFLNKKKTIILIHDLDGIRNQDKVLYKQELDRIAKVDYVIAHNNIMKEKLIKDGVKAKIYTLELFDYLCEYDNKDINLEKINLKNLKVLYAGNLVKQKSPFLHQLDPKKMNFTLNLYGVGIDKNLNKKTIYNDKYPPNILPNKIEGNLGLIWDGNFDESDQNKGMKNYTKYNNPHKLSCYMAAGIPVIVWKKAAVSKFIKENNIGYTIDNIYNINNLDLKDYKEKLNNVKNIQKKVRNGYYTERVINEILKDMGEKNEI